MMPGCRRQLEQAGSGCELEVAVNLGCVLYKEGHYEAAAAKFKEAGALDSSNTVCHADGILCISSCGECCFVCYNRPGTCYGKTVVAS